jgi:hypothetical protein
LLNILSGLAYALWFSTFQLLSQRVRWIFIACSHKQDISWVTILEWIPVW